MMRLTALAIAASLAAPASAQVPEAHEHTINVSGHGTVNAPPDTALIHYWVRGEGKRPTTRVEQWRSRRDASKTG
jgi:uncharacterized protein YggE